MRSRHIMGVVAALVAAGAALLPASAGADTGTADGAGPVPQLVVGPAVGQLAGQPPTSAQCAAATGGLVRACYGPASIQAQYDFGPLYSAGDDGTGQSVVIFDAFGSPTIRQDLATFDRTYGLPAPAAFNIFMPEGQVTYNYTQVPSPVDFHNKNVGTEIGWAYETTLDVEWAHALAPGATIDLVVTPIPETEGVQGIPNLENAQQFALSHDLGTIWSNSWATTEQAFQTAASIENLNGLYASAASQGITAFFASGDSGVANTDKQGRLFPFPTVNFPSSSPDVVSVGGTEIPNPPATITSYQPEAVWHDCCGAGGGGYSSVFSEPADQSASAIPDPSGMRGLPDVSMNAALVSAILIWESFDPTVPPSWVIIGGTSEATPLWAATDAVMNQVDGPLGFLPPRLYQIYRNPALYAQAFHDITVGDNSWSGITGYAAAPGWDAASGLGTPDAAGLAAALAETSP
jgi:subtilase family serine protease